MSVSNFNDLQRHVDHEIKVVEYRREGITFNVAVECINCKEVLFNYENPEVTKMFASWLRATFTIDEKNTFTGYFNKEKPFTGRTGPAFEKDELIRWLDIEMPGQYIFIERIDAIKNNQEGVDPDHEYIVGFNAETVDGPKHLYSPEGWNWDIAVSEDDICYCGHNRGAHLPGGGGCGESDCKCQKFLESDD